ncbi:MAG: TonB-dependent receptor [Bacteroidales bacterium]|nr:TonB-dependent receptor [Bacteroidales bacterium]
MQKKFLIIFLILGAVSGFSQNTTVSGMVYGKNGFGEREALAFANIYSIQNKTGVVADENGKFSITLKGRLPQEIKVSYIGYNADTIKINATTGNLDVELIADAALDEVEIKARKKATEISLRSVHQAETITTHGLQLLACCNLSESFENDPTVDVGYSDAVSGAKQIKMLGLDGKYSLLLMEAMPAIRGLASMYGLTYIPGSWMRSIGISKGASSVESGYESISGQINVGMIDPNATNPLFLNFYGNSEGRIEGNLVTGGEVFNNTASNLMLSGAWQNMPMDGNKDGFADVPANWNANVLNRWTIDTKRGHINLLLNYLHDERKGGQMDFLRNPDLQKNGEYYGFGNTADRAYITAKWGIFFDEEQRKSFAVQLGGTYHNQISFYGYEGYQDYNATQYSFTGTVKYIWLSPNTKHKIASGITFNYDLYDELYALNSAAAPLFPSSNLSKYTFGRTEYVPGAFGEYTWTPIEKFTMVAGLRYDYNSYFGALISPRAHLKYDILDNLIVRVSGGKGYHSPLLFTDFSRYLASSRKWIIEEEMKAEEAWNFGASATWLFDFNEDRGGSLVGDIYYTVFQNQFVVDPFKAHEVHFYNIDKSTALSAQLSLSGEVAEGFDVTLAARYNDVRTDFKYGDSNQAPYNNKFKGLATLTYSTNHKKWQFSLTTQFNGKARVPALTDGPEIYHRSGETEFYTIMHAQITKNWRRWSIYVGAENLLNYTQPDPIIAAADPFGRNSERSYFDASGVWGPLTGRMFYAGLRFYVK